MTGDDDRPGISPKRLPDRPSETQVSKSLGQDAIGHCGADRNFPSSDIDPSFPIGDTVQIELDAGEIRLDFTLKKIRDRDDCRFCEWKRTGLFKVWKATSQIRESLGLAWGR
jgi:hypothetical protein